MKDNKVDGLIITSIMLSGSDNFGQIFNNYPNVTL